MTEPKPKANRVPVYLSDRGRDIMDAQQIVSGCSSRSEYIEWILLCQVHSASEAERLLSERPRVGKRAKAKDGET